MTDGGELSFFLGIKVERDHECRLITLDHSHYVQELLKRFNMQDCNHMSTPLDILCKLQSVSNEDETIDPTLFKKIIGGTMYLMLGTRPDLSAAVSIISQFSAKPSAMHQQAAKRVLQYLKGTANLKLHLGAEPGELPNLIGYSDVSWRDDINMHRSTLGYIYYLETGPISWCSKK